MFWKNKKILITGGTGFIGSYLTERLLKEGATVTILTKKNKNLSKNFGIIKADISKMNFNLEEFEYVFHLAAIVGVVKCNQDMGLAKKVNVKGTENILRVLKSNKNLKKFIYASTANVYGDQEALIKETSPAKPIDFYAKTKLKAEKKVLEYKNKLPVAIIRISNVYGPRQKGLVAIPRLIKEIKNIPEGGEIIVGAATRDFIYIDDVVEAMLLVAEKGHGIYNLGTGEETRIKTIAKIIITYLNKPLIIREKAVNEMKRCHLDITKIKFLGWGPRYNINKGLEKILEND